MKTIYEKINYSILFLMLYNTKCVKLRKFWNYKKNALKMN